METLIYFDESTYQREIAQYEANLQHLQKAVDAYNKMQLPALNEDEFQRLFTETESLIFDKMTGGEPLSIAGLKVNKNILHKPDGYEVFSKALEYAISDLRADFGGSKSVAASSIKNHYDLNSEGKVVLKGSFIKQTEKWNKKCATSDAANKVYQFANFIIDKCNELGLTDYAKHNPNGFQAFLKELIDGGAGKDLKINVKGILEYNNK